MRRGGQRSEVMKLTVTLRSFENAPEIHSNFVEVNFVELKILSLPLKMLYHSL